MMHSYGSCAFTLGTQRVFIFVTPCVPYKFPLCSQCIILHCEFSNVSFCPILRAFTVRIAQFTLRFSPCVSRSFREFIFSYEFLNGSLGAPCYSPYAFLVPKFPVHSTCFSFRFPYCWFYIFLAAFPF